MSKLWILALVAVSCQVISIQAATTIEIEFLRSLNSALQKEGPRSAEQPQVRKLHPETLKFWKNVENVLKKILSHIHWVLEMNKHSRNAPEHLKDAVHETIEKYRNKLGKLIS